MKGFWHSFGTVGAQMESSEVGHASPSEVRSGDSRETVSRKRGQPGCRKKIFPAAPRASARMHEAGLRRAVPGRPGGDGPVFTGGSNRLDHRATLESAVALAVGIWFVLLRYRPACVTSLSQFASAALPLDVSFLYDWHRMYPAAILRHKRDGLPSVLRSRRTRP